MRPRFRRISNILKPLRIFHVDKGKMDLPDILNDTKTSLGKDLKQL
jgi:hypothetical protein